MVQISPTFCLVDGNYPGEFSLGATHSLGLGFTYKFFTAGFNFYLGHGRDLNYIFDKPQLLEKEDIVYRTSSFRFQIGFKL